MLIFSSSISSFHAHVPRSSSLARYRIMCANIFHVSTGEAKVHTGKSESLLLRWESLTLTSGNPFRAAAEPSVLITGNSLAIAIAIAIKVGGQDLSVTTMLSSHRNRWRDFDLHSHGYHEPPCVCVSLSLPLSLSLALSFSRSLVLSRVLSFSKSMGLD